MPEKIETLTNLLAIAENPAAQKRKSLVRIAIYLAIAISMISYLSLFSRPSFHTNLLWVFSGIWLNMSLNEVMVLLSFQTLGKYLDLKKIRDTIYELDQESHQKFRKASIKIRWLLGVILGTSLSYFLLYCIDHYLVR